MILGPTMSTWNIRLHERPPKIFNHTQAKDHRYFSSESDRRFTSSLEMSPTYHKIENSTTIITTTTTKY